MTTTATPTAERDRFTLTNFSVRYGVLLLFAGAIVLFAFLVPNFLSMNTATSILQAQSVAGIAALGMTLTAIVGDLDLSAGAVAGLSVTVAAVTMIQWALTGITAIIACLLTGLAVGSFNALLIVAFKVPPLLATLGTMFTVGGLKRWLVDGQTLVTGMTVNGKQLTGRVTEDFAAIDSESFLGLPFSVWIFLAIAVLMWVFLEGTRFGRVFYAVGGNPEASRLSGIRVPRYRFGAYAIAGVLASISGIILASRLRQGDVTAGDSVLLDAVAMTLVGYAVLGARKPNALGTFIGALFIGVVVYGVQAMGAPYYTQTLIEGVVIIIALLISFSLRHKGSSRRIS